MKIKITRDIFGTSWKRGYVVEVEPWRGAALIADGHIEVPQSTPCRKNSDLYADSCIPMTPAKKAKKDAKEEEAAKAAEDTTTND